MRLTREVRQQLLEQNEGFEVKTCTREKNFVEYRQYLITGGELRIRSSGKTSWADSRFDNEAVATDEQTRRFLREHLAELNTDGV
ncbi:hypothetical protein ABZ896_10225 [Streptomyces sp. NPDC047072]|uniref:hypothetical protein n=1 Tax=Streptomyces sp. NPDC047072 TaxID=3154809 RepID=UPI0034002DCA